MCSSRCGSVLNKRSLLSSEEEKLDPIKTQSDAPRIRLLNRLYAKKRKELQEKQQALRGGAALLESRAPAEAPAEDSRSLEEVLAFIDGVGSGASKASKKKGKAKAKNAKVALPPPADALFPEDGFEDDDDPDVVDPERERIDRGAQNVRWAHWLARWHRSLTRCGQRWKRFRRGCSRRRWAARVWATP